MTEYFNKSIVMSSNKGQVKHMKTYEVTTTETLTKTFRLEASSETEAWEMAEAALYAEGIELMDMHTENEEVEEVNWVEDQVVGA